MKRLISLLLALMMLGSVALSFAGCSGDSTGTQSGGGSGDEPADPPHEHSFVDGKCECGEDEPLPESDGVVYKISDSGSFAEVIGADGAKTELVIASTYEGVPVKRIADNAFAGNSAIISVTIPESVTHIGDYAFSECSSLVSISIPSGILSVAITAFEGSSAISYTDEGGILYLGNSENPYIVLVGVSDQSITTPTINSGAKIIFDGAFVNCYNLEYKEKGEGTYLGIEGNPYYMLVKVSTTATSFTVNSETKVIAKAAFSDSKDLTSVSLPDGLITIADEAFRDAYNLKSVIIPNTVIYLGDRAFSGCQMLASVKLGKKLQYIGEGCFYDAKALEELTAAGDLENYLVYANSLYEVDTATLMIVAPSSSITKYSVNPGTKVIGKSAFMGAYKLESVTIPESVEVISSRAFAGCGAMVKCNIPEGVKVIEEYAFYNCKVMTDAVLPSTLERLESYAFSGCVKISNLIVPSTLEYLGEQVFYTSKPLYILAEDDYAYYAGNYDNPYLILISGKKNLTKIEINEQTKFINSVAFSNTTATSVTIPDSVVSIGDAAFASSKLESVSFGEGSLCKRIGNSAFSDCDYLTSFTFPSGVEELSTSVIAGCKLLQSVTLPSGLKKIGKGAFQNNAALAEVIIPEGVTYIDELAFYYCDSLVKVVVPASVEVIKSDAFYFNFLLTIYCARSEAAEGWESGWNYSRPVEWNYVQAD